MIYLTRVILYFLYSFNIKYKEKIVIKIQTFVFFQEKKKKTKIV